MFKYFNNHLSRGFISLYYGRAIQHIGYSLIGLFLPIYLMINYGSKIEFVLCFYLISHILYGLVIPIGAQFLNKIGLRRSLHISIFFFVSYYVCLFLIDNNIILFSILALIFLTFGRMLFWLPYHTDLAKFTNLRDRGKSVSMLWATQTFISVIMPIISGFLIVRFDYNIVFILSIIIYSCSIIPFLSLPRTKEKYSWKYLQTIKNFLAKKNRGLILSNMANGAENAVSIIIWPIFIWQILNGNFLAVGVLSSIIVLVSVILQLTVGKYTDKFNKRKLIHWGSTLYASGWMLKIFVLSSFHIFIAGAYHGFTQILKDTPFDALNYELLADQGHYVDEYTALKEMAVQFGKVLMLIFALIIVMNFGINWTFALAALASLFINLI